MLDTPQAVPAVYAYSGLDGIDYYNNTASAITPGTVVKAPTQQGVMYGITRQVIPAYTWGTVAVFGVFDLKLDGESTFVWGDVVYWNANLNVATSAADYNSDIIGVCTAPTAGATDISVRTLLTSHYLR